ncbi:MAG: LLM class flavin-dependent oxidoreductase [Acidimicrobiales bacterium]
MSDFGLHLTDFQSSAFAGDRLLAGVSEVARAMEESGGFSSLWLTDHVEYLGPGGPTAPMPEAYMLLGALATRTCSLELGVLATSVLYRNPALLAKMVTTLDVLSGGRAVLGVGAAHPRTEGEHRTYGYEFPPIAERMGRLEVALDVISTMIGQGDGGGSPPNWPRPLRAGGIPVLVAGSGEQRLLRIAARYADLVNLSFPSGDTLDRIPHKLDVLARHCHTIGRDPTSITVTYKALVAVAPSASEAQAKWDSWRRARQLPELDHRHGVFVGEPSAVVKQLRSFLDSGVDTMIVELPDGHDPKTVALAGEAFASVRQQH